MISNLALKSKIKINNLTLNNKLSPTLRSSIEPIVTSIFGSKNKCNIYQKQAIINESKNNCIGYIPSNSQNRNMTSLSTCRVDNISFMNEFMDFKSISFSNRPSTRLNQSSDPFCSIPNTIKYGVLNSKNNITREIKSKKSRRFNHLNSDLNYDFS